MPSEPSFNGRLPQPLRWFLLCLYTLTAASLLDVAVGLLRHDPSALLYLWPDGFAFDFSFASARVAYLHSTLFFTGPGWTWNYPAPPIFLFYPFYKIAQLTTRGTGFACYCAAAVGLAIFFLTRVQSALQRRGLRPASARLLLWSTLLLSWPLYFALQRGNVELLIWPLIAAGIYFLYREQYVPAALLLGFAGSCKVYPLFFLAMFLRPRKWKELALGIVTFVAATLAALWFLCPDIRFAWQHIQKGIQEWAVTCATHYDGMMLGLDHSIFGLFRQITRHHPPDMQRALHLYLPIAAVLATAIFFGRVFFLPRSNNIAYITCATVLLSPASFDYTLLSVLIPWAWLALLCVQQARSGHTPRVLRILMLLLGCAFAPLIFLHSHSGEFFYPQGSVRSVLLLTTMAIAVIIPLPELRTPDIATETVG